MMKILTNLFLVSFVTLGANSAAINDTELEVQAFSNSTELLQPFIVGGVEARRNEFPWIVHLKSGRNVFCGGTLIKLDVVLTAAHCLVGKSASSITVTAGDHNVNIDERTEQTATAKSFKTHESYSNIGDRLLNDIAVIKLKKAFKQTAQVRAINATTTNSARTTSGIVAGWGTLSYGGTQSPVLMKVTVPIVPISNRNCSALLRDSNSQFCAGQTNMDSCQGDSGGPFICNDMPNLVCGIVSYGKGCGLAGWAGAYQKVAPYSAWIRKNSSSGIVASQLVLLISSILSFLLHR